MDRMRFASPGIDHNAHIQTTKQSWQNRQDI